MVSLGVRPGRFASVEESVRAAARYARRSGKFLDGYGFGMSQQQPGDEELIRVLEEWVKTLTPEQLEEARKAFADAEEDEQD